jgi:uncharacterized membrane protein YgdD (TMEM256/DUF423 family)
MDPLFTIIGSLLAGLGVAFGAFGSHSFRQRGSVNSATIFEIGVRYQLLHALAVLFAAVAQAQLPDSPWPVAAGWLFVSGVVLFSGSLYLLVASGRRVLGKIAPAGGLAFIAGWICLALAFAF